MPDAHEFRPERWLPDAVVARKGTAAEVIDHPLLRAPFSAGARMCPGNKIANFELLTMVAQLVQEVMDEMAADAAAVEAATAVGQDVSAAGSCPRRGRWAHAL